MASDQAFLASLMSAPDPATVGAYADWLEDRGDPRAEYLRTIGRPHPRTDFETSENWHDAYLRDRPELRPQIEQWRVERPLRERRAQLKTQLDPAWVAFVDTLAWEFEPYEPWRINCAPDHFTEVLELSEKIGSRGTLLTHASDLRNGAALDAGLLDDLRLLNGLELGDCAYGAASYPVHPFLCEIETNASDPTAAEILQALRVPFASPHIRSLDQTSLPYPGYTADSSDQIHNDAAEQYIFRRAGSDEESNEDDLAHGLLKTHVRGQKLWYVAVHADHYSTANGDERRDLMFEYVILFAVGLSPHGQRLVGVLTHQSCHNLCD